ncbi:hypothetical protein CALCODRAFT_506056 [Calocera cornea HHB12733]|uniref:Uncharacterized protein n=1 Tax=Calocera cornea HHB12733 TaxID=1353952 RepID=A0A165JE32_9BASI|nr:hypothetical protein CALCODRAFT_506056 [Calocera cornea HHB12733]
MTPVHAATAQYSSSPLPVQPVLRTSPRKIAHQPDRFDPGSYAGIAATNGAAKAAKRPADTGRAKPAGKRVKKEDDGEGAGSERYTDEQVTAMLEWMCDVDHPRRVEKYLRNTRSFFRQMSEEVFKSKRTAESLKGKFGRLLKVYREIIALEKHTGGGDGDNQPEATGVLSLDEYEDRILAAKEQGRAVGSLTAGVVQQWHELHWYEMLVTAYIFHFSLHSPWYQEELSL